MRTVNSHVREDRHGVVGSRHGHVPSLLPGVSVRLVGEDGVEIRRWTVHAACKVIQLSEI